MTERADRVGRILGEACARLSRIAPAALRRRHGDEIAATLRLTIMARAVERGSMAAIRYALVEAVDLLKIALVGRLFPFDRKRLVLGGTLVIAAIAGLSALELGPDRLPDEPLVDGVDSRGWVLSKLESAVGAPVDERIDLLLGLGRYRFLPETRAAFLRVEGTLCLSTDYRRLYHGLLARPGLSEAERIEIVDAATSHLDRSIDLALLVVETHGYGEFGGGLREAYWRAIGAIDLERERGRAAAVLRASDQRAG